MSKVEESIAQAPNIGPAPSDALVDELIDSLGITGGGRRALLAKQLLAHAQAYELHRRFEAEQETFHSARALAKMLAKDLASVRSTLATLHPEFSLGLTFAFQEDQTKDLPSFETLLASLDHLQKLVCGLSSMHLSKRRTDRVLLNAVGGLMLLLEDATGHRATVSRRREGVEPSLSSPEAGAIGILLRSVDPVLQTTTLVNVIEKVRRAHRGRPLDTYRHQLLLGAKITPF